MESINEYLLFTSLVSLSIYMMIGSFKQLKEEVIYYSMQTCEKSIQTDECSVEDEDISIYEKIETSNKNDNNFKKLFKF